MRTTLHCSFCGKAEKDVAKIIAGPGVYICDVCVALCGDILAVDAAAERSRDQVDGPATGDAGGPATDGAGRRTTDGAGSPHLTVWADMSVDEMLAFLPRMASASDQVESALRDCVHRLRERGVTWARIGDALGMTRQSAWGRFSGEE